METKYPGSSSRGDFGLKLSIGVALVLILFLCFLLGRLIIGPWLAKRIQKFSLGQTESAEPQKSTGSGGRELKIQKSRTYDISPPQILIVPEPTTPKPSTATKPKSMPSVKYPYPMQPKATATAEEKPTEPSKLEGVAKRYRIQAGSFVEKSNSEALVAELKKKGYEAATVAEEREDGTILYKVYIGGFRDRAGAEEIQEKLRAEGYSTFILEE